MIYPIPSLSVTIPTFSVTIPTFSVTNPALSVTIPTLVPRLCFCAVALRSVVSIPLGAVPLSPGGCFHAVVPVPLFPCRCFRAVVSVPLFPCRCSGAVVSVSVVPVGSLLVRVYRICICCLCVVCCLWVNKIKSLTISLFLNTSTPCISVYSIAFPSTKSLNCF